MNMKKASLLFFLALCAPVIAENKFEGALKPFMGKPEFEIQQVFKGGRFPNLAVATDGTVLAIFGKDGVSLKRSEDGGKTWGERLLVDECWPTRHAERGLDLFHAGGRRRQSRTFQSLMDRPGWRGHRRRQSSRMGEIGRCPEPSGTKMQPSGIPSPIQNSRRQIIPSDPRSFLLAERSRKPGFGGMRSLILTQDFGE